MVTVNKHWRDFIEKHNSESDDENDAVEIGNGDDLKNIDVNDDVNRNSSVSTSKRNDRKRI